jgi:hypothetical protein
MSKNLKTSLGPFGIGTSFEKDKAYFISTAESPPSSGRYETLIKFLGQEVIPIIVIVSTSPKDAVANHIGMARMAISMNRQDWSEEDTKDFIPNDLIKFNESLNLDSLSLNSNYVDSLLRVSGINYPIKNEGIFTKLKSLFS